ncbi:SprT family zinc-dependent metalloprotease [uncultured Fusobacterium sp.]|uniref:M48 family metallopeptidase n=1 Tax=uncultured Fusobacterium sp. TaxID=159267 RepID=UPI0027DD5103|nr:SprT family zinc-dependent metalloprotease [uncultured Fusobacterium sp.]
MIKINSNGEVVISAPKRVPQKYIEQLIIQKEKWIIEKINSINEYYSNRRPISYANGDKIFYLGKKYILEVIPSEKNFIEQDEEKIYIYCKKTESADEKKKILEKWFREKISIILENLTIDIGKKVGFLPEEIKIRSMKSRWGSCNTTRKIITYNLHLVEKPISAIEYVVLHELSHIPYPHHQKEFWNFVEKYMPDWKLRKKILNNKA